MDWYRKKSWSKEDEEHFFTKLKRARKDGRAQYLRIQAVVLIDTNEPMLLDIAEKLLIMLLADYPENRLEKSSALSSLGDIYKERNNKIKALEFYKLSLDFEVEFPNVITLSNTKYSKLVIELKLEEHYDFVLALLEPVLRESIFPLEKHEIASIFSIIHAHKNNEEMAIEFAKIADENANYKTSGLSYHKHLGIVNKRLDWLDKLVKRK